MTPTGVEVTVTDRRPSKYAPPSTANWFVGGFATRGAVGEAVLITSLSQYVEVFGPRDPGAFLYDSLDAYFREGGRYAYVSRIVGPAAAAATATILETGESPSATLRFNAISPGAWGNDIDVEVENSGGDFRLIVTYDGDVVETSPLLGDNTDAVLWGESSKWIRVVDLGEGPPVEATAALATGTDDANNVTDAQITGALAEFTNDLGPGQVSLPGFTSDDSREAVLAHVATVPGRIALLDAEDTANAGDLISDAHGLRPVEGARKAGMFWPWAVLPGVAPGTTRTVPWSAVQAGLIARSEATGGSPGDPVAGQRGESRSAIGISKESLGEATREDLNSAGVNVVKLVRGVPRTYGNRTLANPLADANWAQLSQSRVVAAVEAGADAIAERFYQTKIDGRGFRVAEFGDEIAGAVCLPAYQRGDLYGDSPGEAFTVLTGGDVNPPADLAAGILRAVVLLRTAPGADLVRIEIVKVPTTEAL